MIREILQKTKTAVKFNASKIKTKNLAWIPVIAFSLTIVAGNIVPSIAGAYGQVQSRSIQMSSSCVSGGSPCNGTGVNYFVSFMPSSTATIGSIDINFCSNDPIIGDTCTAPTGFTSGSATTTTPTGFSTSTGSWGITYSSTNLVYISNSTAQTPTGTSTAITLTLGAVTNPSTLGTFYARILTFDTATHGTAYTNGATPGTGILDAGGIALSTVNAITITAKVQESLTFCVYTATYDGGGGACSAATGTTVTLGNTNGVLSSTQSYVDIQTKYDIATNASHGATVVFTGTPPTSGSNVLELNTNSAMCSSAGTSCSSTAGTSQFGLCTWAANGTTANLTPVAPYSSANCSTTSQTAGPTGSGLSTGAGTAAFGFDIANAANVSNHALNAYGYGSELATETAGAFASGQIAFIGNISSTNVAGIYTTTLTFIATGSY